MIANNDIFSGLEKIRFKGVKYVHKRTKRKNS